MKIVILDVRIYFIDFNLFCVITYATRPTITKPKFYFHFLRQPIEILFSLKNKNKLLFNTVKKLVV